VGALGTWLLTALSSPEGLLQYKYMFDLAQYGIRGRDAKELTRSLEACVRGGRLGAGAPLPTVRALAASLGLSPTTVAAAYRDLRVRGVVKGDGRRGTRVSPRPPLALPRPEMVVREGLRDLATGNPDPAFLPSLRGAVRLLAGAPRLYGDVGPEPELLSLIRRDLVRDEVPAEHVAIVGGALDGIERVLQGHLRPGDRVAVEDPGFTAVFDLLGALGLLPQPVRLDALGPLPSSLAAALDRGVAAVLLTPRAQNPTGAAVDAVRARELRAVLEGHTEVLLLEDDHAGPVAGTRAYTTVPAGHPSWAVVRSVSKWLGPDLRLAFITGDATTVARVEGRQSVGSGWVSHVLQELVVRLWKDPQTTRLWRRADRTYSDRREHLVKALRRRDLKATGRSGFNVWVEVPEEAAVVAALAARGWAVRAGEPYRLESPPAIRVTAATLAKAQAERFADDLASILRPATRRASA
jgi:DNA-binding transcriptional MocR family regulator